MIHVHEITGDEPRLTRFCSAYAAEGGVPIDRDYLARCRAFVWVDGAGRTLGGYLLNAAAPFRSLAGPGDDAQRAMLARLDLDQTFECACLWMLPALRGGLGSMFCWASLLLALLRFSRRDLVVCTYYEGLRRNYMYADAELLSDGLVERGGRMAPKFILLLRGKRGFVSAFAGELVRRARLQVERAARRAQRRAARSFRVLGARLAAAFGPSPAPRLQTRGEQ